MPLAITGAEPKSSICSIMYFAGWPHRPAAPRKFASWQRMKPRAPDQIPGGGVAGVSIRFLVWKIGGLKKIHWLRKALRRQSGIWSLGGAGLFPEWCNVPGKNLSGRNAKGSTPVDTNFFRRILALKRDVAANVSLFEDGVVLQIPPRRRRPRCVAPCGEVVSTARAGCVRATADAREAAAATACGVWTAFPAGPAPAFATAPGFD